MERRNFFRAAMAAVAGLFVARPASAVVVKPYIPLPDGIPSIPPGFLRSIQEFRFRNEIKADGNSVAILNFSCVDAEQRGIAVRPDIKAIEHHLLRSATFQHGGTTCRYFGKFAIAIPNVDGLYVVNWGGTIIYGER